MPKIILWLLTFTCLYGQVLVTKRKRVGMILWIYADLVWTVYNFKINQPEQATLWLLYTVISIWGWVDWKYPYFFKNHLPWKIKEEQTKRKNLLEDMYPTEETK